MTDISGPPERRRTLLYLLIFAGTAALLAGLVELFALGQLGPGPYFNVALGSSVLLVSVLFLLPSALPSPVGNPGTGSGDLPDPLTGRTPPNGAPDASDPSARLPLGTRSGNGDPSPSFEHPGTLAGGETETAPHRPWQVRKLPTDLGGGFALPRNPEGVLATLDQLSEELTKPIPAPRDPGDLATEAPTSPQTPLNEEDLARPVSPGHAPLTEDLPGDGRPSRVNRPLELPTEEELLQAIPPLVRSPTDDGIPDPLGAGDGTPSEERSLRARLDAFRRDFPAPPAHLPRQSDRLPPRRGRVPSPARTHSISSTAGNPPRSGPLGPTDPLLSEEDLQGMLSALEQRLRSGTPPPPGPSTPENRRPWDPAPV